MMGNNCVDRRASRRVEWGEGEGVNVDALHE
jgi:hypothetical protein